MSSSFDQQGFDIRCEWGESGIRELAPASDVVIVVDTLSFTTCVEIAVFRGATIIPFRSRGEGAQAYAAAHGAALAGKRGEGLSLSPESMLGVAAGARIVLPSPNGATITLAVDHPDILAGCLRNATAVARAAAGIGNRIAVIPAGERWPDRSLRPSLEDWVAAGAIISALSGKLSAESTAALAAFDSAGDLEALLSSCGSGRELIERGYEEDVRLAAMYDVSTTVPRLIDGAYAAFRRSSSTS